MDVGPALVSDPKATELMKPRQRTLDDPLRYTQSAAVCCAATGDQGHDATGTQRVWHATSLSGRPRLGAPITWHASGPKRHRTASPTLKNPPRICLPSQTMPLSLTVPASSQFPAEPLGSEGLDLPRLPTVLESSTEAGIGGRMANYVLVLPWVSSTAWLTCSSSPPASSTVQR